MGQLHILDKTGDSRIIWNVGDTEHVKTAKATFDGLRAKGYSMFSIKADGDTGGRVDEFKPELEQVIAVPRIVGG